MKRLLLTSRWGGRVTLFEPSDIDPDVLVGYASPRLKKRAALVLGAKARLRSGTVVYEGSRIGKNLETGHHVIIREENRLGDSVRIWNNSTIDYGCRLGRGVKVHCNCYVAQYSVLEDGVFLAPGVILANDLYPGNERSYRLMRGPWLEKNVHVGVNSTLLPYIRIGAGTLIGAGSVVTHDLPAGVVAWGNPARPYKHVSELRVRERLDLLHRRRP